MRTKCHQTESMVIQINQSRNLMSLQIHLISRSQFDLGAVLEFLDEQDFTWRRTEKATKIEQLVEIAGRICYLSFGASQSTRTNADYIKNLIRKEHESVLEHVSWTFLFTGVSRAFTHQFVRHRVGFAFSQLSQQYHDETDAGYVMPWYLEKVPEAAKAWERAIDAAKRAYKEIMELLKAEIPAGAIDFSEKEILRAIRSAARSVLPNANETKLVVTINARALRHFLKTRGSIPGDVEMRQVATKLLTLVQKEAPSIFYDFKVETLADGSPTVTHCEQTSNDENRGTVGRPKRPTGY